MSTRLRRTGRSFAVVFVAFWIYRLLLAPWIDPSFKMEEAPVDGTTAFAQVHDPLEERLRKYEQIFPPGSWELDQPIMLESEGVELLMKDYENLSGGRIRLSQCTMLYVSDRKHGKEGSDQVVVLRATEGAILQFDADLNLRRGKVGNLIGGQLIGPVTIDGTPSSPGADDELHITTRDVHMKDHKVWSHSVVDFRYGPNYGKGRELEIHLLPGGANRRGGLSVGGIERIELLHDVEMHLQSGSMGVFPGDDGAAWAGATPQPPHGRRTAGDQPPVEVHCDGPFSFNLVSRTASFDNHVDVYRAVPQGVFDRMSCDRLQIFFGDRDAVAAGDRQTIAGQRTAGGQRMSLRPDRLLAVGNPVAVDAPSNGLTVRANQLEYEIHCRRVRIEVAVNQPDASLIWKDAELDGEFGGRSLEVERPDPTRLPIVVAAGPGWLRIGDPATPSRALQASWLQELQMRPADDGSHLVSMVGNAHANMLGTGELSASEIQFWLTELATDQVPSPSLIRSNVAAGHDRRPFASLSAQKHPIAAQRLVARKGVRFTSPQMSGETELLEVRFDPLGTLRPTPQRQSSSISRGFGPGLAGLGGSQQNGSPPSASLVRPITSDSEPGIGGANAAAALVQPQTASDTVPPSSKAQQHFSLHGDSINVELVSQGELTELNHAALNGHVHLLETRTQTPTDRPIEVRGDQLVLRNAAQPKMTTMVVQGNQALVAARGMQMEGAKINLDRRQNLLWIDGAGRTVLPPTRPHAEDQHAANSGPDTFAQFDALSDAPVSVRFLGGMRFDGQTARFNQQVTVSSESHAVRADQANALEIRRRTLNTDSVEVALQRPIDFAAQQSAEDAAVANILCHGPVRMVQETTSSRGPVAIETLTTRDMEINQDSGDLHAFGPGWLETTRRGSPLPLALGSATKPTAATSADAEGLVYVHVEYQGEITGNVRSKSLVFHDDIRGVYGPVERWGEKLDARAPQIGKQEIRFRSDELHVRQVPGVQPNTSDIELQAVGNTDVDGQAFSARAHKLTYVQGKDQLVFEGDGRSVAELYQQSLPGGGRNHFRASRLEYRVLTGEAEVSKGQFLELGQTLAPRNNVPVAR